MDLYAALPADAPQTLQPGERALISTGSASRCHRATRRRCGRAADWRCAMGLAW